MKLRRRDTRRLKRIAHKAWLEIVFLPLERKYDDLRSKARDRWENALEQLRQVER